MIDADKLYECIQNSSFVYAVCNGYSLHITFDGVYSVKAGEKSIIAFEDAYDAADYWNRNIAPLKELEDDAQDLQEESRKRGRAHDLSMASRRGNRNRN
jgi:hypothetical protein